MIDTVLFDLDGTLLSFTQDEFITDYFSKLKKVFQRLEIDADAAVKAVWSGTKAMMFNDGTKLNEERFWEKFAGQMKLSGKRLETVMDDCVRFYSDEFDTVKRVLRPKEPDLPRRLVQSLSSRGFSVALATNPLFPACAVTTRLGWIGLSPEDFCLITDYSNSRYCKPNHDYYREILSKLGKAPRQCLMVGNNTVEDMSAGELGLETFLITDCLENEVKMDISAFRKGTLSEAESYLAALPYAAI